MDRRIAVLLLLMLLIQLFSTCVAQPVDPNKVINNIKNWGLAGIKIAITSALILVIIISIIRGAKGAIDYSAGPGFVGEGLREMYGSIKKQVAVAIFLILLVWSPEILAAIGLYPEAPFKVDWNSLFSGGG